MKGRNVNCFLFISCVHWPNCRVARYYSRYIGVSWQLSFLSFEFRCVKRDRRHVIYFICAHFNVVQQISSGETLPTRTFKVSVYSSLQSLSIYSKFAWKIVLSFHSISLNRNRKLKAKMLEIFASKAFHSWLSKK